jgi:hypothetical protein
MKATSSSPARKRSATNARCAVHEHPVQQPRELVHAQADEVRVKGNARFTFSFPSLGVAFTLGSHMPIPI